MLQSFLRTCRRLLFTSENQWRMTWGILALALLPFLALSFYNHPMMDDFSDATVVRTVGFWKAQQYFYLTHTGRYTITALLALINPLIYARLEEHWWPVTLIFLAGSVTVLRLFVGAMPGLTRPEAWRLAALILSLWLAYAPGHAEGLYWFTGAYTYITSASLLLLWLLTLSRYLFARQRGQQGKGWWTALCGLAVAVAGTVEPIALPFAVSLIAGAILASWRYGSHALWLPALLAAGGCLISISAPGNFVRMGYLQSAHEVFDVTQTLAYAGGATGYLLLTWIANPVLWLVSAMLLPVLGRAVRRREHPLLARIATIHPLWMALGLMALLMLASCPAYFASGTGLPLRARFTLHLLFLISWFGLLLIWCWRKVNHPQPAHVYTLLADSRLTPLWTLLLPLFFLADYNIQTRASRVGQASNNVVRAYRQWLGGSAARYTTNRQTQLREAAPTNGPVPLAQRPLDFPDVLIATEVATANPADVLQQFKATFQPK
jgi:hypothetical protein